MALFFWLIRCDFCWDNVSVLGLVSTPSAAVAGRKQALGNLCAPVWAAFPQDSQGSYKSGCGKKEAEEEKEGRVREKKKGGGREGEGEHIIWW